MALATLYMLHDSRVEGISVQGDLIVDNSDEIITRSRAKQRPYRFATVPAHARIIKLLVKELGSVPGSAKIPSFISSGSGSSGNHGNDENALEANSATRSTTTENWIDDDDIESGKTKGTFKYAFTVLMMNREIFG